MSNPWYARTLKAKSKPAVMRKQSDAALGTITGFDQLLTGQLAESGGTRQHLSHSPGTSLQAGHVLDFLEHLLR